MSSEFWKMGGNIYSYATPRVDTERDIELPWAQLILARREDEILEVGDATSRVVRTPRTIVDRHETNPGPLPVARTDIVDWEGGPYDLIISISTLEHVGVEPPEEPDEEKASKAILNCLRLLKPGGEFAFTIPCGYHPSLHEWVLDHEWTDIRLMGRPHQFGNWYELPPTVKHAAGEFPYDWNSARRVLFVRYVKP